MHKQSGFTLIEIAIVLVIIGLLLGGILKGQELINSAKVKNLAQDFRAIPVYIYGYQDKFKALPGDDKAATTHLTGADNNGNGNGIIEGKYIPAAISGPGSETLNFWQHVRLAVLAPGPTALPTAITGIQAFLPSNAEGGVIGITNGTATDNPVTGLRGTYVICSTGILGKFVKQLDTTLDDGVTNTGSMMTIANQTGVTTAATPIANADINDADTYTICMGV
jgi:prepilin-type N-terminal cleavage/methylation domain-containing protein